MNGYPSVETGEQTSHDEIRAILSNDLMTHTESILKKVREKICISTTLDGDVNKELICVYFMTA